MTYDGLTATADHLVWIEGQARPVYFGFAAASGARLIRTEYCGQAISMSTPRSAMEQEEQTGHPLGITHQCTARLYDIRNAGPHHRFTVSGRLVHNCGYGGGVGALKAMGAKMPEEEMQPLVDAWRAANPNIVAGRNLCYQSPHFTENRFGSDAIGYYAPNAAGQMVVQETFGGKLAENATQAIARDILAHALLTLEKNGYPVIFHVHDEAVIEKPTGQGSLEEACRLMANAPDWAEDLPLRADGEDHLAFYRKT